MTMAAHKARCTLQLTNLRPAIISEVDGEAFNQHLPAPIIAHPRQTRCPSSGTNSMYGSCCVFISRVLAHFDRLECVDTYVRLHITFTVPKPLERQSKLTLTRAPGKLVKALMMELT
jgi:hypothetical protein